MDRTRSHEAGDGTSVTHPYENPLHASSILSSIASFRDEFTSGKSWKGSGFRHTLGIVLLLITVVLWTASNFLASVSLLLYFEGSVIGGSESLERWLGASI